LKLHLHEIIYSNDKQTELIMTGSLWACA